jgi:hypothetical protein
MKGGLFYVCVAIENSVSAHAHDNVWQVLNALIICELATRPDDSP